MSKIKLGYFASGSGSSVEQVDANIKNGELEGYESGLIVCNKARGKAGIYKRAERLGIPIFHYHQKNTSPEEVIEVLQNNNLDYFLGLGYIKLIDKKLLDAFPDKRANIHPTKLPKYGGKGMYGLDTHKAVLAAGDAETAVTIHKINERFDEGDILKQVKVKVPEYLRGNRSIEAAEELQKIVLQIEYETMKNFLIDLRGKIAA